jgi:hypothetical protein
LIRGSPEPEIERTAMGEYFRTAPPEDELTPMQQEALREIAQMLRTLAPAHVRGDTTGARRVRKGELEIEIPHSERPEQSLLITVAKKDIAVSFGYDHMHFDETLGPREPLDEALSFIWDILRGRVEVDVTTKGRVPVKTRVYRIEEDGSRVLFETLGLLWPHNPFARKQVERHLLSFV